MVTRAVRPPGELLHLVIGEDGAAHVDRSGKAPGRGAWVTPTREALEELERKPGMLARALDTEGIRTAGLLEEARAVNFAAVLDLLSLAARSGRLASGGDQVRDARRGGELVALVAAADASAQSVDAARGDAELETFVVPLDRDALGHRIGKGPRAVVGIRPGGPATALVDRLRRMRALG